jgi:hypothetical protein
MGGDERAVLEDADLIGEYVNMRARRRVVSGTL